MSPHSNNPKPGALEARQDAMATDSTPARTLRLAASMVGSEQALASALGVSPMQLACWLANLSSPPREVLLRAIGIVMSRAEAAQSTH